MRRALPLALALACSARNAPPEPSPAPSAQPFAVAPSASTSETAPSVSASVVASASAAPAPAPPPQLSTTRFQAWIYEKPKADAPHAGWLRAGMRVTRVKEVEGTGCKGKWWQIEPGGFLCEGQEGVTTNLEDPIVVAAASRPPDATSPFPYGYVTSNGSPMYVRVPTVAQQKAIEGDIDAHLAAVAAARAKLPPEKQPPLTALPVGPMPSFLEGHKQIPNILPGAIPSGATQISQAWRMMRMSVLSAFEAEGRTWYLTGEHFLVPADRMRAAKLADFHGVELNEAEQLPMVWVRWKPPRLHKLENGHAVLTEHVLPFQAHARVAAKDRILDNTKFHELLAPPEGLPPGTYLVRPDVVNRVDAATELPFNVGADELWIEVSLLKQTLVLYRGLKPLFVTLVSTGVDVMGDPETSRATPRGHFRIHSKHISWRMAGDEKPPAKEGDQPDPRYRIDDVPYVQYFHAGYALHAAFWHDAFGQPKSHGCINLSPRDALWMFGQTEPKLPSGWHGVYSSRAGSALGTTLVVHM